MINLEEDCPKCHRQGWYKFVKYPPINLSQQIQIQGDEFQEIQTQGNEAGEEQTKICDCQYGQLFRKRLEARESPDYVNPFTGLSPKQMIGLIGHTIKQDYAFALVEELTRRGLLKNPSPKRRAFMAKVRRPGFKALGRPLYRVSEDGKSITCLCCDLESFSSEDVRQKYCVFCDAFHDD